MSIDSLDQARTVLRDAERVAVFSGAGLSAESGIATFRDVRGDGLWLRFDPFELASEQGFFANPERVIAWYNWRRKGLALAEPNAGHRALAAHPDWFQITQNVDDLLERAGIPDRRIAHLHGRITKDRCHSATCDYEETIELADPPSLRSCPECGHLLRPAVVWFGESLPERTWRAATDLCSRIDCLLVVGTSASVYPAAGLIDLAKRHGSRIVLVNTESTEASPLSDVEIIGSSAKILPELLDGSR